MKLFWLIISIFALAAGAMVWAQARIEQPTFAVADSGFASSPVQDDPIIARTPARVAPRIERESAEDPNGQPKGRPNGIDDVEVGDADELARELVQDLLDETPPPVSGAAGSAAQGHDHQDPQMAENPWSGEQAATEREPIKHSIEKRSDGSTLIDGLFNIRGDGTANSPYEITWDLLMSAAETYQPRLGMTDIPERIQMLDGKHVRISGFLMFPMATFEAKEALVMMNMWDGCCIGTMPSPYDAIEVQFSRGVPSSVRQFSSYGSVEGRFVVDPYLLSDWLIGLYLLEDASLDVGM